MPAAQRGLALERDDERVRHLAFAQVRERVLAGAGRAEVELVVDRLERDAEVQAVAIERVLELGAAAARARAGGHRPAEQRRGLALDDAEVRRRGSASMRPRRSSWSDSARIISSITASILSSTPAMPLAAIRRSAATSSQSPAKIDAALP